MPSERSCPNRQAEEWELEPVSSLRGKAERRSRRARVAKQKQHYRSGEEPEGLVARASEKEEHHPVERHRLCQHIAEDVKGAELIERRGLERLARPDGWDTVEPEEKHAAGAADGRQRQALQHHGRGWFFLADLQESQHRPIEAHARQKR